MAYTFYNAPIFGFDSFGSRVRIGKLPSLTRADCKPIGGKLYYANPSGDGEYEFFTASGILVTEAQVATAFLAKDHALLDSLVAYRVVRAGTIDKYYVFHDAVFTSKRWTYYENGEYIYNSLGTKTVIGEGKANTELVMSADSGKYVTNDSNGQPTVWYKIKEMRDALLGGCDDWFLPSRYELEELRKAIGFVKITTSDDPVILSAGAVTGGTVAGTADGQAHYKDYDTTRTCYPSANAFLSQYLWSSSEYSAVDAWSWPSSYQYWNTYLKNYAYSVVGVRAF